MMISSLPSLYTDPITLVIMVICGSLALFAMFYVARHDCRTFTIDFLMLFIATLAILPVILVMDGLYALLDSLVTAVIFWGVTWLAQQLMSGKIGMGDIPLMGFIGLVSGSHIAIPVLVALVIFSILTSAAYSIRRGKRLFKSSFPMALPGMLAAALAFVLRLIEPVDPGFGPIDTTGELIRIMIFALVAMIVIMIGIGLRARIRSALKKTVHDRKL